MLARSRTHKDYLEVKKAEADAGEEEDEDEEEEGEVEGEGEGEGEEEAADYGEEVEDPDAWNQVEAIPNTLYEDKYFVHGENLR